jgi:4-amino-4-deoxy-L-arabinose transferase-like glycosyltransferase
MVNFRMLRNWFDHPYGWQRIMLLALLLRVICLILLADDHFAGDSEWYHLAATKLLDTGEMDTYWPPGLPLYEAGIGWVFGTSEMTMRISMLPWFFWLCRVFYHLAFRLHSRIAANVGLLFLAFFPAFVFQSVEPLTYLPAAALLLALVAQLHGYFEGRRRGQLLKAAVFLGLLILFRPSALFFLLAIPPLLVLRRRKLMPALLFVFFAGGIVGGWVFFTSKQAGRFVPLNDANARNFYLGNNTWTPTYRTWHFGSHWEGDADVPEGFRRELGALDALPIADQDSAFRAAAWRDIATRPGAFAVRTLSRVRTFLAFDMFAGAHLIHARSVPMTLGYGVLALDAFFYGAVGILSILFWFSGTRRELSGGFLALWSGSLLVYALPYLFAFSHPTYHTPILPLMLLPVGVWLQRWLERDGKLPHWRKGSAWLAFLCLLIFIAIQVEFVLRMNAHI